MESTKLINNIIDSIKKNCNLTDEDIEKALKPLELPEGVLLTGSKNVKPYKFVNVLFPEYTEIPFQAITVKEEFLNMPKKEFIEKFPDEWKEMKLLAFDNIIINEFKIMASEDVNILSDLISDVKENGEWEFAEKPETEYRTKEDLTIKIIKQ